MDYESIAIKAFAIYRNNLYLGIKRDPKADWFDAIKELEVLENGEVYQHGDVGE
jgi:hypothetical protein